jgi:hypothetical protein
MIGLGRKIALMHFLQPPASSTNKCTLPTNRFWYYK